MKEANLTATVSFSGIVQGVSFRKNVQAVAVSRGITGWVRNEDNGSVTACFSGPEPAVKDAIEDCMHLPHAVVTDVKTTIGTYVDYGDFRIR
ncbi:MAG: acylphosphatase [Thermoplasmataceae archaeon]